MFIQRAILVLLVLSYSVGLAQAEWVELTSSASGDFTVHVDHATIRADKQTGLVQMWVLKNFQKAQEWRPDKSQSFLSVKTHMQFDCKEEQRFRPLAIAFLEGNMADGKVIFSDSMEEKWKPVARDSITE